MFNKGIIAVIAAACCLGAGLLIKKKILSSADK